MSGAAERADLEQAVTAAIRRMPRLPVTTLLELSHGIDALAEQPAVSPADVRALLERALPTRRRR